MTDQPHQQTFKISRPKSNKSKDFKYHIRVAPPEEVKGNKENYRIYKFPHSTEEFELGKEMQTYHVWGDDDVGLICDCPASTYHQYGEGNTTCKHVPWVKEFVECLENGLNVSKAYWDTTDERMHF